MDALKDTKEFWDSNPCGIHEEYTQQRAHRFKMDAWLISVFDRIAKQHSGQKLLEVGCGQGIDSVELAKHVDYTGVDYSPESVAVAQKNAKSLGLNAHYSVGNAESLFFQDGSFDAVYSCGVIHHTFDEHKAISEVYRVLKPDGTAWVSLYATTSPKVFIALGLRSIQKTIDKAFGTDRAIYRFIRSRKSYLGPFGTMFHECFGVPYLKSYTRKELERLFSDFSSITIERYGSNIGTFVDTSKENPRGYLWQVIAKK